MGGGLHGPLTWAVKAVISIMETDFGSGARSFYLSEVVANINELKVDIGYNFFFLDFEILFHHCALIY